MFLGQTIVLLQALIRKFGWKSETREEMLADFVRTRPEVKDITEEDVIDVAHRDKIKRRIGEGDLDIVYEGIYDCANRSI